MGGAWILHHYFLSQSACEAKRCNEKLKAYLAAGRATEGLGQASLARAAVWAGIIGCKKGRGSDRHALKSFWDLHYLARTTFVCVCVCVGVYCCFHMAISDEAVVKLEHSQPPKHTHTHCFEIVFFFLLPLPLSSPHSHRMWCVTESTTLTGNWATFTSSVVSHNILALSLQVFEKWVFILWLFNILHNVSYSSNNTISFVFLLLILRTSCWDCFFCSHHN